MTSERVGTPSGVKKRRFSVVKAHLSHEFERTHDTRTFTRSSGVFGPQVTRANGFHKEVIVGCELIKCWFSGWKMRSGCSAQEETVQCQSIEN